MVNQFVKYGVRLVFFAALLLLAAGCATPGAAGPTALEGAAAQSPALAPVVASPVPATDAAVSPAAIMAASDAAGGTTGVAVTPDLAVTTGGVATPDAVATQVAEGIAATLAAQAAIDAAVAETVAAQAQTAALLPTASPIPSTATALPTATMTPSATPTITPTPCLWTLTARLNANIRSGPDELRYDVIGTLPQGQMAAIIGRSEDDAWSVIDHSGRRGWISDEVVSVNSCPGDRPPPVPSPVPPAPSPTPVIPYRSCGEIRQARPDAADGYYTLYVGGDVGKPFEVYCLGMGQAPAEYLPLPNSGEGGGSNYVLFKVGGATQGSDQVEYFRLIRLNPFTLEVDRTDRTFSTMVGLYEFKPAYRDNHTWRRMQYGEVRSCIKARDESSRANVDLRGTPFTVDPSVVAVPAGFLPAGRTSFSPDRKIVDMQGGGFCGGYNLNPLRLTYVGQ